MANDEHLQVFKRGVKVWNWWREMHPDIAPDLSQDYLGRISVQTAEFDRAYLVGEDFPRVNLSHANLSHAYLVGGDFREANLMAAKLVGVQFLDANFSRANLASADLSDAALTGANLSRAVLCGANLQKAALYHANLSGADLSGADLSHAILQGADLSNAILSKADLSDTNLTDAVLVGTNLVGGNLREANLMGARLIQANLEDANLTNCAIYEISSWEVQLNEHTEQRGLIITRGGEPLITVDSLEVAQFIHLLLNNQKIRSVIDTITSKTVLILGRFTPERKVILDALRDVLRRRNYVPMLFDFDKPASRDLTETITLLARMSRFIIADLTSPRSIPQELAFIIPQLPSVPVQPLLEASASEYGMFEHFKRFPWVLAPYRYQNIDDLLASLEEEVVSPAEKKAEESNRE